VSYTEQRCTMCGVVREHHEFKAHPYTEDEITADYTMIALRGASFEETLVERCQRKAREAFKDGRHEVFDLDCRKAIENATRPGRVIVELETGGGLVGDHPNPEKRIFVRQNESWVKQFAILVAASDYALVVCPELRVGQQLIVTRCAGEEFLLSVEGFSFPARFMILHVSDVEGVVRDS
jgi:hypothetical protein